MRDATVCLSHGILPPHWAPGVHRWFCVVKLLLPSVTHQLLAGQTGFRLPTAGIWVCAFNVLKDRLLAQMTSLKKDPPYRPHDSKPEMNSQGARSFLKLSRWDANDCSPGNNPPRGANSRMTLSSYPKKPTSQLSKQARGIYRKGGNSGNRWGETKFSPLIPWS